MLGNANKKYQEHNCKKCGNTFNEMNLFNHREDCCRLSPPPNAKYPITNVLSAANVEFLKWVDILPTIWCFSTWRSEGLNVPEDKTSVDSYCNQKPSNLPFGTPLKI